jgi:hypothetical protein
MSKLLPIIEYFIDNQLYWDFLVKWAISLLMIVKIVKDLIVYNLSDLQTKKNEFINHVNKSDIADHEKEVNDLHYEVIYYNYFQTFLFIYCERCLLIL